MPGAGSTDYNAIFSPELREIPSTSPGSWLATGGQTLPGRSTVPNIGTLPGGGTSGKMDSGGGSYADLAGAVVPLLFSLFGGKNKAQEALTADTGKLRELSTSLFGQGKSVAGMGQAALAPVLKYFMALAGGDPSAMLEATAPERARVLDQYDTSKKAFQFGPRGGGQASATATLEASKASTLSTQAAEARRAGATALGTLGESLTGRGISAEEGALTGFESILASEERQAEETRRTQEGLGGAIGKVVTAALPFFL